MHREHDERAKLIAEQALDRLGEVQRELEIPATDAMRFDLSLKRCPTGSLPTYLTLLALLLDGDCMIEVFSQAVPLTKRVLGQPAQATGVASAAAAEGQGAAGADADGEAVAAMDHLGGAARGARGAGLGTRRALA